MSEWLISNGNNGNKSGNNGNSVTLPSVTTLNGNTDLLPTNNCSPLSESVIRSAYFKIKVTKSEPSARDIRTILGKGSFRTIQNVLSKIKDEESKLQLKNSMNSA